MIALEYLLVQCGEVEPQLEYAAAQFDNAVALALICRHKSIDRDLVHQMATAHNSLRVLQWFRAKK
jgi:cell division protein ZapA (FtsZ GTPase activity inhibitor)